MPTVPASELAAEAKRAARATIVAAIYIRVSTAGQEEDGTSLDTQLARCRAYCLAHGYLVDDARIFREVHTGTELWERPKLSLLRDLVRRAGVGVVVCFAIDRLSRDPVHLGVVLSEAEHAGVQVEFVTEPLDNSPEGQLIRYVRGYAAKVEHEKITERSIRSRRNRIESGKLLPGFRAPYGYRWRDADKSALDPDAIAAAVVRRIFRDLLAGRPLRAVALALTLEGVPTPTGTPGAAWHTSTVRVIVRNPLYAGRPVARLPRRRGTVGPREELALPAGIAPALVEPQAFAAVRQQLARNKAEATRNNRAPAETLLRAGFARCGECGSLLNTHRVRGKYLYYRCTMAALRSGFPGGCRGVNIAAATLDTEAWKRAHRVLTKPEIVAAELVRLRANDPTEADLAAIERSLADTGRRQANIARSLAILDDEDAAAPLHAELQRLAAHKRQLEADREAIADRQEGWRLAQQRLGEIETWCRSVARRLETLDYHERRLALEALGMRVTLWPADHAPRWEIETRFQVGDGATDAPLVGNTSRSTVHNPALIVLRWTDADGDDADESATSGE